ncbi:nuclear factor erythroid 2-related factor 3 [Canis lupus familiaris]|uniref:Nuclear factor erythroid 2-related factor 3 n=2 Tax=Canis lupus familiaris TaxID=9615 RepID=A0A8I3RYA1_CANLF|nr:nuclear factor erythroid 2-related factor 3 [Canis lupus familiaris]XP_038542688.1 nuclear factor erythroid 2-related factor 3 [Canis lupus familiaris]XP_539481.3 nuclear factor erythroid 2-related factor 3 [Canis lupus familiaris]
MKYLKPRWSDGGGLLHLTVLLSLAGLRLDLDLDLYLLLPPPTLLWDELLLAGGPTSATYALSPFAASAGWGRADQLHPKGREPEPEGRLLREVRALGVPFIPRTRVDAWLVHSVAAADADGAHGLLGATASAASAGGVGAGVEDSSQAAPGDGDPRAAASSPVAAGEEERAPAGPTAQVLDAGGRANQGSEVLREKHEAVDHSSQNEENEQRVSSAQERSQKNEESKIANNPDWEAEKPTESSNERALNGTDTAFSLEDLFQMFSSQPENSLEGISLEDTFPGNINDGVNSSIHHNVNFSQAISQDVNLHEAMLLCPDNTFRREPVARTSQEPFLHLNSQNTNSEQNLPGTNLTGFFPLVGNQMRNLTSQDLLYDLDLNIFDEINLMSLATGFDPMEVAQLFEEPDSDSGLSLNSSHNSTSVTKSNSSHSVCEGATGSSSDLESLSHHDLEGAVGGYYAEPSKLCHMDHRSNSGFHGDLTFQHVFHNHTYHLQPSALESTSTSLSRHGKSQKSRRYLNDTDRNLSRDERRAKALHIPFSVDEIVRMPVDSFNNMLSRHYLTDLQVSLIRDIRRRGKNKVAAQNCRKRKLDIILNLEDDVCNLQAKREILKRERARYNKAINTMKQKLHELYHDIFSRLRDDEGRPVNPNQYVLQCSQDGSVLIVPKELVTSGHKKENHKGKRK